jgi:EAL domain-containing protein (putative c-di-GMP-specific phosphodiesterase class I)/DNA-binding NarL/FixJ family response regulator
MAAFRVVIADDDPLARSLLEEVILSDSSLQLVGAAADTDQAIELAALQQPDVAIIDVKMPRGGGPRAAREIRTRSPETRVLAHSSYSDRAFVFEMLQAGAASYLIKGSPPQEILAAIHRCLHGQATLSPEVAAPIIHELAKRLEHQREAGQRREQQLGQIRRALDRDALQMVFQPIADLKSGRISSLEALARFAIEPQRSPAVWFAEASEVGLRLELELAALRAALSHLGSLPSDIRLSVNLSPETVTSAPCRELLAVVPGERLIIEVTEDAPVEDYDAVNQALRELRTRGGQLAIDDAGAGFASLRHILRLDPDIIKLDLTLTRGIDADRRRRALASALISFASEIGATIVAEGIETQTELDALRELGVAYGQGYYLARPGPLPLKEIVIQSLVDSSSKSTRRAA